MLTTPKLTVPREVHVARVKPQEVAAPKVIVNTFQAPRLIQTAGGARLARLVRTGEFGSSAVPTVNAPIQKVQTGGFGDPNGVKGEGKENAHLTVAKLGSLNCPKAPDRATVRAEPTELKARSPAQASEMASRCPATATAAATGAGPVNTGGFGGPQIAQNTGGKALRTLETGPATTPVEILYKPQPNYTSEARALKLEGEVLIEVMFGANGQLQVQRVVRGLGHGLDESGVEAAHKIRFKPAPAQRPVDSTASCSCGVPAGR